MLFNSIQFAIFLPVVFLLYWFVFNRNLKLQNLFVDYVNSPISYDSTYFYNNTHMNEKGAEKFTLQLAKDLDNILSDGYFIQ